MTYAEEQRLVEELKSFISGNFVLSQIEDDVLEEKVKEVVAQRIGNSYCSVEQKLSIVQQVYGAIRGFGLLDAILKDESITEVMINGPENIFIEQKGHLFQLDRQFESEKRLEDIIQRIVGLAGREVNQANPICDTTLPDGSRVNVVLPPIALCGPTITIRKFSKEPMTMEKLIRFGSLTKEIAEKLQLLVKARYNIFVCGGTGSGKTTFLNALSNYIPRDERVITVEDTAELQIENVDNLVRLETMVLQGAANVPLEAIKQQIGSAVDIIIHLSRLRDRSRKTMEITEVLGFHNGEILLNPLYVFEEDEQSTVTKVHGILKRTENKMQKDFKLRLAGINTVI